MDVDYYNSLILYFSRSGFYQSMQKAALDGLTKFPSNFLFKLYNGIALTLGNRIQEGIRELKSLKSDKDFGLSAVLTLIYANRNIQSVDRIEICSLEDFFQKQLPHSSDTALYYSAIFFLLTGQYGKCSEFAGKILSVENNDRVIVLKTWNVINEKIDVSNQLQTDLERIVQKEFSIDASMALVKLYQLLGLFENAIQLLNKLSIRYPELNIFVIEKMNIYFSSSDWDQAYETALRIINLEPMNINALLNKVVILLIKESKLNYANSVLCQLLGAVEQFEINSSKLVLNICSVVSRVCSRNKDILKTIAHFLEKLTILCKRNVDCLTEYGFILLMMDNHLEALSCFEAALKIDDYNGKAVAGSLICRLVLNNSKEIVEKDIENYRDMRHLQSEPYFIYLKSIMTVEPVDAIKLLNIATDLQLGKLRNVVFGIEYLNILNADFMINLVMEYLRHSPTCSYKQFGFIANDQSKHITWSQAVFILETILKSCPNHLDGTYMLAMLEFMRGNLFASVKYLHRILNHLDPTHTNAKLLLAKVAIEQAQYLSAGQSLDLALSNDFSVRKNPLYFFLLGIINSKNGNIEETQKSFSNALQLIDSNQKSANCEKVFIRPRFEFTSSDKLTLYLEYSKILRDIGDHNSMFENERIMQLAIEEFKNTKEEGRLLIAQSSFLLQKGKINDSIKLLENVTPEQLHFKEVNIFLADIYLKYKKNRIAYANCFKKILLHLSEPSSYHLLAGAYMTIQESTMSLQIIQRAFDKFPDDNLIATQLGRTYVKAHQYKNAIQFYKNIVENKVHIGLKLDLAELYLKLNMFVEGIKLLENIEIEDMDQDVELINIRTKTLLLLARIYEKSGSSEKSLEVLKQAKSHHLRTRGLSNLHISSKEHDKNSYLKICLLISEQAIRQKDTEYAFKCLEECLNIYPNNIEVLVAWARLHLQTNSIHQCYSICNKILDIDEDNETASIMMADISVRKVDFENAAYHFSQLLLKNPCNWTPLVRLIEIMRRMGNLNEVLPFLQRAQVYTQNTSTCSAFYYCKGLYEWWSGNPNNALLYFNKSKKDPEWGKRAIIQMIEICVNPDGDLPDHNEVLDLTDTTNIDFDEPRIVAFRTAEKLLKELSPRIDSSFSENLNYKLLQNFLLLASRIKYQIEVALKTFSELLHQDNYKSTIGPIYGLASGLILVKQTQKAKSHLKSILSTEWSIDDAEYFEKSWLLLANIYINSNKLDVAESLILKTLEYNRSSTKAYELAGIVAEKSQSYKEAAKHYKSAWTTGGKSNKNIGYKLAFTYMKVKNFAEAMVIAQEMLRLHPDWTFVHKDILEKCRLNLRT